ncbi:MAG: alpha/beta hydrolase [Ilumatobacteraceae bacterium]
MLVVRRGLVAAVALLGLLTASCTSASKGSSATTDPSNSPSSDHQSGSTGPVTDPTNAADATLDWGRCTDPSAVSDTLECATIAVPIDYDAPDGSTIDIALVRVPASGDREGAVLVNPGGPGGSGFDYVASGGATIGSALGLEHQDLIGFDPRGVDRSGGIRCLSDAELDKYAYPDDTPDDAAEQALLDEADTAFAAACSKHYGDTLRFYSTANTARDIDQIRRALGDDTISFLGISYGTYLGAMYATMFPEHVRAMVLDSAFEPGGDTVEQQYLTQLVGFEHAFDDWATWCEGETTCRFRTADVGAAWDALRQRLDDSPITNADGRIGNQALLQRATKAALYSRIEWPVLGAALADADGGDPSGLFRLADQYFSRDTDGSYATIQQSNAIINCASGIESETPPDPVALAATLRAAAPRFAKTVTADDLAKGDGCADLMPNQPLDPIGYDGEAPIVVIGGTNDPATPFRWAEEMTKAMGRSARLVTYTGEGHGQLLASSCVTAIEASLVTDLELPDADTVCTADPDVERPEWWDLVPTAPGVGPVVELPEVAAALGLTPTAMYSEIHVSEVSASQLLGAYRPLLEDAGFKYLGEQSPLTGAKQAVYSASNSDLFSVLVLGSAVFDDPQLRASAALIPDGEILVVLLYIPQ